MSHIVPESKRGSSKNYYNKNSRSGRSINWNFPVVKTRVENLDLDRVKPQRAGVIIYTVVDDNIFLGLGVDSASHDLTDFGGGVIYKKDKTAVKGALREFKEETLEIFSDITPDDIRKCPVIYDNKNLIIFVHMAIDPDSVCSAFIDKYHNIINNLPEDQRDTNDPEVCGITWLNWEEFQNVIKNGDKLYSRVREFLKRAEDFSYLL